VGSKGEERYQVGSEEEESAEERHGGGQARGCWASRRLGIVRAQTERGIGWAQKARRGIVGARKKRRGIVR